MKSYRQWRNKRLAEQAILIVNLVTEPIGNEAGEHVLSSPFSQKVEEFKKKITEIHPKDREGLGN